MLSVNMVVLGSPARSREFDPMIHMGPFQHEIIMMMMMIMIIVRVTAPFLSAAHLQTTARVTRFILLVLAGLYRAFFLNPLGRF